MGVRVRERDGCWWVFINHQYRRKAKKIGPGPEGKRIANLLAEHLRARLASGEPLNGPQRVPLLKDYATDWMRQVHVTKKPGTAETYARHMRNVWLPALGMYPLDQISRSMVKRLLLKLQDKGLSRDYVLTMLIPLQACFAEAVDDEIVKGNPAARQARSFAPSVKKAKEIFLPHELEHLLTTTSKGWPTYYVMLLILARTGMREGEMLALQPGDIDFHRQQILVQRTWGSRNRDLGHACINTPKSGKWRGVDMSPQLADVLKSYLAQLSPKCTWLFAGKEPNLPLHPASFQFTWTRILAAAGLPSRPPHSLRHTYASLLIDQGENMLYVRDQLGHSSIRITMDIYGHLVPGSHDMGAAKLDSRDPIPNPFICNPGATSNL